MKRLFHKLPKVSGARMWDFARGLLMSTAWQTRTKMRPAPRELSPTNRAGRADGFGIRFLLSSREIVRS